ncbi:MAG: phosphate regulon sensor protein PhoR, partial [Proteobacteria bacterium]|nr:phosphate regulon sensor protein PhoR [Pseudomonadota bacterium]
MFNFWRRALLYPFVLLLISWLLWETAGALFASLFLSALLLVYVALHLRQLAALDYWLDDLNERMAPDGAGLWGEIFARLNKMIRRHRKERAQRVAALQHMEQAISALPEGVTILDEAYRIEWCNLLAEQHFGLDCSRDIGQQITYLARQPELIQYLALREFA